MKGLWHTFIMVDSCGFWSPDLSQRNAIEELLKLETAGVINPLEITEATEEEQDQIGTPPVVRKQSIERNIAVSDCNTPERRQVWQDIRNTLFGNKSQLTRSDKIDIGNVYTAWDYGSNYYFVTYDKKHILSKAQLIWERFKIRCYTP